MVERETSIRRGIDVLLTLARPEAQERDGLSVTRISELLGREKSQVSRSLKALSEYGLVERDPDTLAYVIGWRIFTLAALASEQRMLNYGGQILERLSAQTGEQSFISVLYGTEAVVVLSQTSTQSLQALTWVGRAHPSYASATGTVLLGDHDPETLRALFSGVDIVASGGTSVSSIEEFIERVQQARADGYAVTEEQFEAGLVSVAAPVRDHRRRVAAVVNVSGPRFRMSGSLDESITLVKRAASDLTAAMAGQRTS